MVDETAKSVVETLLQYGVLGIVTILLVAWGNSAKADRRATNRDRGNLPRSSRYYPGHARADDHANGTMIAALNELAKVEEGRIAEVRQFYETLRKRLEELDKALSKLFSEQGDQLKALTRAHVDNILAGIQALRADVIATLEVLRRHR